MKDTVTICFTNNKGGSGKSTTCSNVGAAMAQLGKKVLLVDGDMQLNLSLSFFSEEEVLLMAGSERNLYYAVRSQADLTDYIVHTAYENLDLVPSSTLMSSIEYELFPKWQREYILKKCLKNLKASGIYDYILIDAPPTLGGWVLNILCASDKVIVPVEASPWGMFGLANMFDFLEDVKEMTPDLEVMGIVVTKADQRKGYYKQTLETLKKMDEPGPDEMKANEADSREEASGGNGRIPVFDSIIRIDSNVEWAQDNSAPVVEYKKNSRSAIEYVKLAEEVMSRAGR